MSHEAAANEILEIRSCEELELLRTVTDKTQVGVYVKDRTGCYRYCNDAGASLMGRAPAEILGKDDATLFGSEAVETVQAQDRRILATGTPESEDQILSIAAETRVFQITKSPYRDAQGIIQGIIGISRELTVPLSAEHEFPEKRQYLRLITETTPHWIYVFDLDQMGVTYTNRSILRDLGYPRNVDQNERSVEGFASYMPPEELPHFARLFVEWPCLADGQIRDDEYRLRHADGSVHSFAGREIVFTRRPDGTVKQVLGTLTDITRQKRAEELLRQSESALTEAQQIGHLGSWVLDLVTNEVCLSTECCRLLGLSPAENHSSLDVFMTGIHADDRDAVRKGLSEAIADRRQFDHEFRYVSSEGQIRWVQTRGSATYDKEKRPVRFVGISQDITERKAADEVHRESEARFRLLFDGAADAIFWADAESGILINCNRAAEVLLGWERNEIIGQHQSFLHPTEDAVRYREMFEAHASLQSKSQFELEVVRKDGSRVEVSVSPSVTVINGQAVLQGIFRDISERKRAEQERQLAIQERLTSEERFSKLFYASPFSIILATYPDGKIIEANNAFLSLFGFERQEVLGKTTGDLNIWVEPHMRADMVERLRDTGSARDMELLFRAKSGDLLTLLMSVEIVRMQGNAYSLAMSIDITERKQAEADLHENQERLRLAVQATNLGPWDWELLTGTVSFSAEWKNQIGYEDHELSNRYEVWESRLHPEDRQQVLGALNDFLSGKRLDYKVEFRLRHRNGEYRWIYTQGMAQRDASGKATRIFGCHLDVTDRKLLGDQLRQSQKMEAVGQLAGGIAHDFNNLLTVINGYCDLLLMDKSVQNPWATAVQEIYDSGRRAAELTQQLLTFSRRSLSQPRRISLNDAVDTSQKLLRRLIGEHVVLTVELDSDLGVIHADVNQLEQVLMNLAVNARDAMPGGGHLTITTKLVSLTEEKTSGSDDGSRKPYARLQVIDTGIGIEESDLSHIFEPFFTTKDVGKGSGLGLAVVHGIVQQHGGRIHVASQRGAGTTFTMYFPLVDNAPELQKSTRHDLVRGGTETILLVEDEASVRKLTRTTLELHGFHVVEACNGHEALQIANGLNGKINLLLTDVVMPGINGHQLANALRVQYPRLLVMYVSGYHNDDGVRKASLQRYETFLAKPFSAQELVRRIRDLLDLNR